MAVPAIEFHDVRFARPGGLRVLDRFTLAVDPGDVLALVGRSGAGKTTVLKLVNRLLLPDEGAVLVEGRDTRVWEPIRLRRRVGYVLQDVGLFPHMRVGDNVSIGPRLEGWAADRTAARVDQLLELVGLPPRDFAARWPDELSGGQRQRVGVARALAVDPPVLLMDEPFGALDPLTRAELHAEFRRIQQRLRKTVIIVTHDMGEAFALASRIGVLDGGVLVACDRPEVMAASPDPRVRCLLDAVPTVPAIRPPEAESVHPEAESLRSRPRDGEAPAERGEGVSRTPEAESLRSRPRDSEAAARRGGGAPRE